MLVNLREMCFKRERRPREAESLQKILDKISKNISKATHCCCNAMFDVSLSLQERWKPSWGRMISELKGLILLLTVNIYIKKALWLQAPRLIKALGSDLCQSFSFSCWSTWYGCNFDAEPERDAEARKARQVQSFYEETRKKTISNELAFLIFKVLCFSAFFVYLHFIVVVLCFKVKFLELNFLRCRAAGRQVYWSAPNFFFWLVQV